MSEAKTGKVKNVSGEDLIVSWLGGRLVLADQAVEVPLEDVWAYTQQAGTWEPYDAATRKAHKEHFDVATAREAVELAVEPESPDVVDDVDEEPPASAAGDTEKQEV